MSCSYKGRGSWEQRNLWSLRCGGCCCLDSTASVCNKSEEWWRSTFPRRWSLGYEFVHVRMFFQNNFSARWQVRTTNTGTAKRPFGNDLTFHWVRIRSVVSNNPWNGERQIKWHLATETDNDSVIPKKWGCCVKVNRKAYISYTGIEFTTE